MATTTAPDRISIERVLDFARAYVVAIDAKRYSHAHLALSKMADAIRALPSWLLPAIVEPAAEVCRDVTEAQRYRLAHEDGHVVLAVTDDADTSVAVLTEQQAEQMRGDLARVLAAIGATGG
jgi:uncharacterized protein YjaG (DUF416 family)